MKINNSENFYKNLVHLPVRKMLKVCLWDLGNKKKLHFFINEWNKGKHIFACYESTVNNFKL